MKVMDFSQNYTCLLTEEIMSLHWQQNTITVYPVVVLRLCNGLLREDDFVFFSEDKEKDPWFVELCNEKILEFYSDLGMTVTYDIEFTDGCGSQFKSVTAFRLFAERSVRSKRIYFETAHGKSKSDGLGGVVKSYCSAAVNSGDATMRDCQELFEFAHENLTVLNRSDDEGVMVNRIFFNISVEEANQYQTDNPVKAYYHLKDTLKIHQIGNKLNCSAGIYRQAFPCCCTKCLQDKNSECQYASAPCTFIDDLSTIKPKWEIFREKGSKRKAAVDDDDRNDTDDNELDEFNEFDDDVCEEVSYVEGEAYGFLHAGDIAVIRSGDEYHPFYLLKLNDNPFETVENITDDYHHSFPMGHRVIKGNYLELFKEGRDGEIFFLDTKHEAIVSSLCILGICPELEVVFEKRRGKQETMYFVDFDLRQAFCELVKDKY